MLSPRIPVLCPLDGPRGQAAGPRVFITGSARSGTTLLLNLFRLFTDVSVLDRENCIRSVVSDPVPGWLIAKRTPHCAEHLIADLPLIDKTWIVDITRDPRDVVSSKLDGWPDFYCDFTRWARDARVIGQVRGLHLRLIQIRYERLVTDPSRVMSELGDILGLGKPLPSQEYPSAVPEDLSPQATSALGGVRPVSRERVGRWRLESSSRRRVAEQLKSNADMEVLLQYAGYEVTEETALP